MLGFRNDIPQLMIASDCLLLPSLWEGFPTVAIEAQAAGLECLCSNTITKNVIITNKCKLIPLTIKEWIDECQNVTEHKDDDCKIVADKGFDIVGAALRIAEIYDNEITLSGRK
jgi:glycosyltransferase involved in cell wall biosynthesis